MRPEDVGYDQARPLSLVTFIMMCTTCFDNLLDHDDDDNGLLDEVTVH